MNVRGNWDSFLYNFMSLVPGAQPTTNGFSISFSGTRYTMNNFTVDGITTNSTLYGNQVGPANPSMDFVREVRVDMSGNSAEFAAPGYVNVVTKGGENKLHGSAYWYYNTAGLNARNTFQNRVAFAVLNDYGFTVSGPVIDHRRRRVHRQRAGTPGGGGGCPRDGSGQAGQRPPREPGGPSRGTRGSGYTGCRHGRPAGARGYGFPPGLPGGAAFAPLAH